jgi:hypothetical protein
MSCATGQSVQASLCFIPFGGGATYCPGRKFARNEIKTMVAQLFVRFKVESVILRIMLDRFQHNLFSLFALAFSCAGVF